jgi:uncharacterized protein (UPF0303 family)
MPISSISPRSSRETIQGCHLDQTRWVMKTSYSVRRVRSSSPMMAVKKMTQARGLKRNMIIDQSMIYLD